MLLFYFPENFLMELKKESFDKDEKNYFIFDHGFFMFFCNKIKYISRDTFLGLDLLSTKPSYSNST